MKSFPLVWFGNMDMDLLAIARAPFAAWKLCIAAKVLLHGVKH